MKILNPEDFESKKVDCEAIEPAFLRRFAQQNKILMNKIKIFKQKEIIVLLF